MEPEISAAISEFKTQPTNRPKAAKKLLSLIEQGIPLQKIEEIFGVPNNTSWIYALFYSSLLTIYFDTHDKVECIEPTGLDEVDIEKGNNNIMSQEVVTAISEFKNQPIDRRKAAAKLLPIIKTGMSTKEIEAILGTPTEMFWNYTLSDSSFMTILFDINRKVRKLEWIQD